MGLIFATISWNLSQRGMEFFNRLPHLITPKLTAKLVDWSCKDWSLKFDDALWAYGTAHKTPLGATAYQLVFGKLPFNSRVEKQGALGYSHAQF